MSESCKLFEIDTKGRLYDEEEENDSDNSLCLVDKIGKYSLSSPLKLVADDPRGENERENSLKKLQRTNGSEEKDDSSEEDDSDEDGDVIIPEIQLPIPAVKGDGKDQNRRAVPSIEKKCNISLEDCYLDIQLNNKRAQINEKARRFTAVDDFLKKKSTITPGFEKLEAVPAYYESDRILQKKRKKERERTKGSKWFNMPAPEMTDELKHDLEVIQMRSVLDPKRFYKKNDLKVLPKYFQVGKVVNNPADFYHSRIPKKQRKRTIVEELLADSEFRQYNKRRYKEIIEERRKTHYKAHIHAKKLKRKK